MHGASPIINSDIHSFASKNTRFKAFYSYSNRGRFDPTQTRSHAQQGASTLRTRQQVKAQNPNYLADFVLAEPSRNKSCCCGFSPIRS